MKYYSLLSFFLMGILWSFKGDSIVSNVDERIPVNITINAGDCYIHIYGSAEVGSNGQLFDFHGTVQVGGGAGCPKFKHFFRSSSNPNGDLIMRWQGDFCNATEFRLESSGQTINPDHLNFLNLYSSAIHTALKNAICL